MTNYNTRVLDVGSGAIGVGMFMQECDVVSLDLHEKVKHAFGERIRASGTNLPFKNDCFDSVISVDFIEHINTNLRKDVANEMMRVGKEVLVHCPVGTEGEKTDKRINQTYRRIYGKNNVNTMEHLNNGIIYESDLRTLFPNSRIKYSGNAHLNYISSVLFFTIYFFAFVFHFLLKSISKNQPYYSAIMYWSKI